MISKSLHNTVKNIVKLVCFLVLIYSKTWAQKPLNPIKDTGPKSKIELIRADSLIGENTMLKTHTFLGNVIFKHNGVLLGCQKAIHNMTSNYIEAYGKIILNQGDTLTIVGDTLYYEGNLRMARVSGQSVILRDKKATLRTTKINYDLNNSLAYYPVFGTINQDSSKLSSYEGYYNTKSKIFKCLGDVQIINPSFVLCTDSLNYDTYTKQAYFNSKTLIRSKDGDLTAYKGAYNIKSKISKFEGRAKVVNLEYSLEADTLNFDNENDAGTALGNVLFHSFADSLKITGNKGIRTGNIGLTTIIGETVSQKISGKDTVFIASDKLWIYEKMKGKVDTAEQKNISPPLPETNNTTLENTIDSKNNSLKKSSKSGTSGQKTTTAPAKNKTKRTDDVHKIIATGKVKIYKKDFQAICDSLNYDLKDSLISFFQKPILWNNANQLEADTITLYLKNNQLSSMKLIKNSFVIQTDTLKNYNQIKGRIINAFFGEDSQLNKIKVDGNGESLYFALDEKNHIIGLNSVLCSNMQFLFTDKKIYQITFRGKPESQLIPPKEIVQDDMTLEGFAWKKELRPIKKQVINKKFLKLTHQVIMD